jgi:hypothetical protein
MRRRLQFIRDDHGSVLIFVAVMVPVLIAAFAIVVDVGNWFVHKRSLQNEVDAAALAGGSAWGDCFNGAGTAALEAVAAKYAGGTYNLQVGGSVKGTLGVAYNSTTYPPNPPAGVGPDDTTPDPCVPTNGRFIFDVKATEKAVPLLLNGLVPTAGPDIHATARVELRQVLALHGLLPLGVPDVRPQFVFVQFVDEDNAGSPITSWVQLAKGGTVGINQYWTLPVGTPSVPVTISSNNIGVRVRLVGGSDPAAACGQTLVDCYDAGSVNGIVHIRGWSSAAAAPAVRNAWLLPGTCAPDSYFATGTCSGGLQAEVDLGTTHPLNPATGASAVINASVDGNGTIPLTPPPTPTAGFNTWNLNQGLPFTSTGPHTVSLAWKWQQTSGTWTSPGGTVFTCNSQTNGANANKCVDSGALGPVQRAFVSDPVRSGPVQALQIGLAGGSTAGANSFQRGSTQNLTVTLGTPGNFEVQAATANAPLVTLRLDGGGSLKQTIDCDPNIPNLRGEIAQGCAPGYTADDTGAACPSYNALWSTAQPWYCVKSQTGGPVPNQIDQGFNQRIQGGANGCVDDNAWPNYPLNDTRIVPLFLTPFGSFQGNGNDVYPVTGFGAFYVTGYNGDPCPNATPNVPKGGIVGHFINYIVHDPGSTPSPKFCDINSLVPCIPVLVK